MDKLVIIGSGIAGVTLAANVKGFEVVLISKENILPYYRMRIGECLKGNTIDSLFIHPQSWYEEKNIKLLLGLSAVSVDTTNKTIKLSDSTSISYDVLVFATGSDARMVNTESDLSVAVLRSFDDVKAIQVKLEEGIDNIGILGGGVLGLELATLLSNSERKVTVIESAPYLLPRQLNEEAALFLEELLRKKGITVIKGATVTKYHDNGITFSDGSVLPLSLLCLSIGVISSTNLAKEAGINVNRGIIIDEAFKTNKSDIYAIGDCAELNNISFGQAIYAQEMGFLLAKELNGNNVFYKPSSPSTIIKISDIPVVSLGVITNDYTVLKDGDKFESYFVENGILKGAILINSNSKMASVKSQIGKEYLNGEK